jgi:hypothetical protein
VNKHNIGLFLGNHSIHLLPGSTKLRVNEAILADCSTSCAFAIAMSFSILTYSAPSPSTSNRLGLMSKQSAARVLTPERPIIHLRSYPNRNFALGPLFSFVLGIGLYGLTLG